MKKISIIEEAKTPPDARTPLTPVQCNLLSELRDDVELSVVRSPHRCYLDEEYAEAGISLRSSPQDADILLGIKEVPVAELHAQKTYLFFSHTTKKQAHNRELLRAILQKRIHLIDYEMLTNEDGERIIAFGHFAGMVGAHNALWTWSQRTGDFSLPRMHSFKHYEDARKTYMTLQWPAIRIVLTGTGRVGSGAAKVLQDMGIRQVTPQEYLTKTFDEAVFTQLAPSDYVRHSLHQNYNQSHFYSHPEEYISIFEPYLELSDIFINGVYWDVRSPAFFSLADIEDSNFRVQVIADITCDIAPESSIPTTLKATTIADPVFGYDHNTQTAQAAHTTKLDMMTIDNLPNELARDASLAFGQQLLTHVIHPLLADSHPVIERATIAKDGELGAGYQYLQDYVE